MFSNQEELCIVELGGIFRIKSFPPASSAHSNSHTPAFSHNEIGAQIAFALYPDHEYIGHKEMDSRAFCPLCYCITHWYCSARNGEDC